MEISIEKRGDVTVFDLKGSLDAETVSSFRKRTQEAFDLGASKVVIGLAHVPFIDSIGLGAMIALLRRVRKKGGDVKLSNMNSEIKEVFEITRLHRLFDVCKDINSACAKF